MAIRETLELDISQALNQLNDLERELDGLFAPVSRGDNEFEALNRELDQTVTELKQVDNQAERTGRELEQTGRRGSTAFVGLTGAFLGFAGAIAAFQGFSAIGRGIGVAIDAASDLAESTSKANVVFGRFSGTIKEFSEDAPQALGLSSQAALEATATFGNLFTALGLSQQAAADLSPDVVQLASDLASFNNLDVADALEKLRSGLVGEAEPLRALGVSINEAVVSAKALELGLVGANGEITEAAKVQARYALILEQTTNAQGDFARTADGIANKQRTLNAEFDNFQAAVGAALLPAFDALLDQGPKIIDTLESLIPVLVSLGSSIEGLIGDGEGLASFLQTLAAVPDALGTLGQGASALGNFGQAFGSLFRLDPEGFFQNLKDGINDAQDAADAFDIGGLRNGLINALQEGVDPALALADALAALTRLDLEPEKFADTSQALLSIANLPANRIRDLVRTLTTIGPSVGLAPEAIEDLRQQISLLGIFSPEAIRLPGTDREAPIAISKTAAAIRDLALAGEDISGFALDVGVEGITGPIDTLTTTLDAARDSIEDDTGAIIEDLNVFFDTLNNQLDAQVAFQANLATLRLRGQDLLANLFEGLGPEQGAQLLADAVTDPASAAQEEARLEEHGRRMARAEAGAALSELTGIIQSAEVTPLVIPLTFGGLPDIPISAITGGQVGPGGQVTIIEKIEFNTTPSATVDTDRITQSIGSINRNLR